MRKLFNISGFFVLVATLCACREQAVDPDPSRLGVDFFPIENGMYWEYEVDLTTYNLLDSVSSHFFLKEVVADSFTDLSGDHSYMLERFVKYAEADEWELDSVWTARVDIYKAVKTENNVAYVKMVFPVEEGTSWNGNALNARQEERYQARNLGVDLAVGDSTFANTLTVVQREVLDTLVFHDVRREYYARGVGLIKKEFIQLNYCSSPECFGQRQVDSGRRYYMYLVANGKE